MRGMRILLLRPLWLPADGGNGDGLHAGIKRGARGVVLVKRKASSFVKGRWLQGALGDINGYYSYGTTRCH